MLQVMNVGFVGCVENIYNPVHYGVVRQDCAFIVEDQNKLGMHGMNIVHIQLFFSFSHDSKQYPCALVEWFSKIG